jgi:type II secretory pathway pseudopilin PulG
MKTRFMARRGSNRAFTLVETLFGTTILSIAIGSIYVGSMALQKSFRAAQHYSSTHAAQMRVLDYVSMDLRRAFAVKQGNKEITLLIPDYYDRTDPAKPKARHPRVENNRVVYGNAAGIKVRYYITTRPDHSGRPVNDLFREEAGVAKLLVSGIQEFEPTYADDDPNRQIVKTAITFPPIFRAFAVSDVATRNATATHAATMLRNKREDILLK